MAQSAVALSRHADGGAEDKAFGSFGKRMKCMPSECKRPTPGRLVSFLTRFPAPRFCLQGSVLQCGLILAGAPPLHVASHLLRAFPVSCSAGTNMRRSQDAFLSLSRPCPANYSPAWLQDQSCSGPSDQETKTALATSRTSWANAWLASLACMLLAAWPLVAHLLSPLACALQVTPIHASHRVQRMKAETKPSVKPFYPSRSGLLQR